MTRERKAAISLLLIPLLLALMGCPPPEGSLIFLDRDSRYSAYGSAEEPPGISIKGHLGL